jgi:hypothetical protein
MTSPNSPETAGRARSTWTWTKVPRDVVGMSGLHHTAFRVFVALLGFAGDKGTCYPSNAKIGKAAGGLSNESVRRALEELERLGLVSRAFASHRAEGARQTIREGIVLKLVTQSRLGQRSGSAENKERTLRPSITESPSTDVRYPPVGGVAGPPTEMPPQQNLWVRSGSGRRPRLCKRASFATLAVRNPYDFLVTSFTLLLSPSTAPDEI